MTTSRQAGAEILRFPTERTRPARLVDMRELREHFGMSERYWRYRIADGLPVHRWGRTLRFDLNEVKHWIEEEWHGPQAS